MGFSLSYLAAQAPMAELAKWLNLSLGPHETGPMPDTGPYMLQLTSGWTIYMQADPEAFHRTRINPHLGAAASKSAAFVVSVLEGSMWSSIEKVTASSSRWRIEHRGDTGDTGDITHLQTTGTPPKYYAELRDRILARAQPDGSPTPPGPIPDDLQKIAAKIGGTIAHAGIGSVDHGFDVPLEMALKEFGFRHDQTLPRQDIVAWAVPGLTSNTPTQRKPGLIARIFGRE